MKGPVVVRLAGAAVALGLHPDAELFGEVLVSTWLALRASAQRRS